MNLSGEIETVDDGNRGADQRERGDVEQRGDDEDGV